MSAGWVTGELVRCGGALPTTLRSARVHLTAREGLWLKLRDADGHLGVGECAPLPGYSRETLEECTASLRRWLEAREASLPPAAQCAVDGALLDLLGQQTGTPAYALLATSTPTPLPLSRLITTLEEAREAIGRGFRTLKLKVGGSLPQELALLEGVRNALGPNGAIRLDANGAYAPNEARAVLAQLAAFSPEFIEEPAPTWTEALADSPVPLALDESLATGDRRHWRWAKIAVLKPMLLGGPKACLALAEELIAAGLKVTVSHTWDGPVGLATAATTALAIEARWPGKLLACGLTRHPGLAAWPERELPFLTDPQLVPGDWPGLGVRHP